MLPGQLRKTRLDYDIEMEIPAFRTWRFNTITNINFEKCDAKCHIPPGLFKFDKLDKRADTHTHGHTTQLVNYRRHVLFYHVLQMFYECSSYRLALAVQSLATRPEEVHHDPPWDHLDHLDLNDTHSISSRWA